MKRPPKSKNAAAPGVKILNEDEIQKRLYGTYSKVSKRPAAPSPAALVHAKPAVAAEPEWTGAEILAGELKRLRDELIVLRKEREDLEKRLEQKISVSVSQAEVSLPSLPSSVRSIKPFWGVGKFFLLLGLVTGLLYPLGIQLLQASPVMRQEPTPYTIQVGVYDVKPSADQMLSRLLRSGYPAFQVQTVRIDGKPRYRIYVGKYVTKEEASLEKGKLSSDKKFSDAFVRLH